MSFLRRYWKLGVVAAGCTAIGAGASVIASAGAASSTTAKPLRAHAGGITPRRLLGRAVHAEAVVPGRGGFVTVTLDRGKVQSVSGQQLTITEGTQKRTYKTLTLTIPTTARVRDNAKKATLADVKVGQRVVVVQAPTRTLVLARDAKHA